MTRLAEIKEQVTASKGASVYPDCMLLKIRDAEWLVSELEYWEDAFKDAAFCWKAAEAKLEKAIEVIKFYGSGDRWSYKSVDNEKYLGQKAREFLEQMKCL